ncbi:MAG: hypothetical protein Q9222_006837 [Ikaeria aurantiellina]
MAIPDSALYSLMLNSHFFRCDSDGTVLCHRQQRWCQDHYFGGREGVHTVRLHFLKRPNQPLLTTMAPSTSKARRRAQGRTRNPVTPATRQLTQVDKLAISKSDKEFRNQMLKDKGSWSYDWRTPLRDLEEQPIPGRSTDTGKTLVPINHDRIQIQHNIKADDIPKPSIWTEKSFHVYVAQLASSKVDRLVARRIYPRGIAHADAVADILTRLFADQNLRYAVSITAGNVGLGFFFSHGRFARGRNLFDRLQELQKGRHSSTFNIMLKAAADQKDLFTFTYILKTMIRHGVRPNLHTWIYLAQAVQDNEVRMKIVEKLSEKGLLRNSSTLQAAVATLMPQILTAHFISGKDYLSLLESLDSRFGPHWYSGLSCERIVEEVGLKKSIQEALVVLQELHKRGYNPTQGMLLLLLRQCSWTKAHKTATEILRLFHEDFSVNPSRPIYDVLFKQAWRNRLHNSCRVIWMHACVTGHTSFNMQETIRRSLYAERSLEPEAKSLLRFWEEFAGKVITGHGMNNSFPRFLYLMSLWKPANESVNDRDRFLRAVKSILNGDLAAVGQYDTAKPLDELFSEALAMDERWAAGRALRNVPIECKYSQLIDVGLGPINSWKQVEERPTDEVQMTPQPTEASSSGQCWMSPEMRLRPCTCPAYVRERMPIVSDPTPSHDAIEEHSQDDSSNDSNEVSLQKHEEDLQDIDQEELHSQDPLSEDRSHDISNTELKDSKSSDTVSPAS